MGEKRRASQFRWFTALLFVFIALSVSLAACATAGNRTAGSEAAEQPDAGASLNVVATTSIVADVVRQVAGDHIHLEVLLPQGADPHGFEPSPRDIARIADADLVFASGAGLEEFLQPLLENAGGDAHLIEVSQGVELLEGEHAEEAGGAEDQTAEDEHEFDPHVWMDPENVMIWTHRIEETLVDMDPQHAGDYSTNAKAYRAQLEQLDAWIREEVARVPEARRQLVVDHLAYTYFAEAYGFTQVAAVFPGFSTLTEPSAQQIARLEEDILRLGVQAIFVGNTVNPALAGRIAADTNTQLVQLYSGSLSEAGGEADSYQAYMRYNVSAIVSALGKTP